VPSGGRKANPKSAAPPPSGRGGGGGCREGALCYIPPPPPSPEGLTLSHNFALGTAMSPVRHAPRTCRAPWLRARDGMDKPIIVGWGLAQRRRGAVFDRLRLYERGRWLIASLSMGWREPRGSIGLHPRHRFHHEEHEGHEESGSQPFMSFMVNPCKVRSFALYHLRHRWAGNRPLRLRVSRRV